MHLSLLFSHYPGLSCKIQTASRLQHISIRVPESNNSKTTILTGFIHYIIYLCLQNSNYYTTITVDSLKKSVRFQHMLLKNYLSPHLLYILYFMMLHLFLYCMFHANFKYRFFQTKKKAHKTYCGAVLLLDAELSALAVKYSSFTLVWMSLSS